MNDRKFEEFLDNATHAVNDMWKDEYKQTGLTTEELYQLNDLLTDFFAYKKAD